MSKNMVELRYDKHLWSPRLVLGTYNFHWYYTGKRGIVFPDAKGYYLIDVNNDKISIRCNNTECNVEVIEDILGLNEDLHEFFYLTKHDPLLSCSEKALKGYRLRKTPVWESIVISIMQQNNSFKQGWRILYKLIDLFGKDTIVDSFITKRFPTPEIILEKRDLLYKTRMGYREKTLITASLAAINNELPVSFSDLMNIKGIGRYTACNTLLLSRRDYSCPPIDSWVLSLFSEAYEPVKTISEAEKLLKSRFPGYMGLAINFLTILTDAEPRSIVLKKIKEKKPLCPDPQKIFTPLNLWMLKSL